MRAEGARASEHPPPCRLPVPGVAYCCTAPTLREAHHINRRVIQTIRPSYLNMQEGGFLWCSEEKIGEAKVRPSQYPELIWSHVVIGTRCTGQKRRLARPILACNDHQGIAKISRHSHKTSQRRITHNLNRSQRRAKASIPTVQQSSLSVVQASARHALFSLTFSV